MGMGCGKYQCCVVAVVGVNDITLYSDSPTDVDIVFYWSQSYVVYNHSATT